jgi:hypothetical protein
MLACAGGGNGGLGTVGGFVPASPRWIECPVIGAAVAGAMAVVELDDGFAPKKPKSLVCPGVLIEFMLRGAVGGGLLIRSEAAARAA